MKRSALPSLVLIAALGAVTAQAGIWGNVFRGLDYVATPTGSPVTTTGDGTRINGARSGRVRIVPNGVVGGGYRLEFDRTFGADSHGRPETLRFPGGMQITLSGATQLTAGYNDFTHQLKSGFADFSTSNLAYDLRTRNGLQDVELTGTLNAAGNLNVNMLGFYDLSLDVSNTNSTLKINGVAVRDQQPTNFDVGPIVIQGNIFWDAFLALLGGLGVDTSHLQNVFPNSAIGQIDQLLGGTQVAGQTAENNLASLLAQTILGGNDQAAQTLVAGLADGSLHGTADSGAAPPLNVPEPGTLLLVTVGGMALWHWRRR